MTRCSCFHLGLPLLGALSVILAVACAPAVPPPAAAPAVQPTTAPAAPATVKVTRHETLGPILTDPNGRTVYLWFRDERNKSNCNPQCSERWHALSVTGAPQAGEGVAAGLLGTLTREGGALQVTYNGWPLYFNAQDAKPGDTKGHGSGSNWWVVSSYGGPVQNNAAVKTASPMGPILTDVGGRTLYLFAKDQKNKSTCAGACAQLWPPLLTVGEPKAEEALTANLVGAMKRDDGTTQVTYNGWPLHYYAADEKPGDLKGQNVGGDWFVVTPAGEANKAPAAGGPVAPAPRGDGY